MKKGFTLAEVLITLGIIGVVAAATIPSLITAYQKRATESQLKKAYSTLVNALRMSENDPDFNYTPPDTYEYALGTHDKYGIFKSYFAPYMQGVTVLTSNNRNWRGKTPAGADASLVANFGDGCHCINDGTCFRMVNHGTNYFYILVDLNGPSRPNIVGRDIFYFALHFTDNGLTLDGNVYQVSRVTTNAQLIQRCGKGASGWSGGSSCTELIIRNSWKIPKDYPWN